MGWGNKSEDSQEEMCFDYEHTQQPTTALSPYSSTPADMWCEANEN